MYYVDFETHAIDGHLPPRPVGLAVRFGGRSHYYAFGHPSNNNCTEEEARQVLADIWGRKSMCFHNAKFDYGVAVHHWKLPHINPLLIHDTMALASLDPSITGSLALKTLAQSRLNIDPTAQDDLHHWIETHLKVKKNHGAHIASAPGDLVGVYAKQDVDLTQLLFEHFGGYASDVAYRRLQQVMPVIYRMEQRGVPVDGGRLADFTRSTSVRLVEVQESARAIIGELVNLDSPASLMKALVDNDLVDQSKLARTPKGKLSSSADSLMAAIRDPELAKILAEYRHVSKLVSAFLLPWQSRIAGDGRLHAQYRFIGATRTGRMSSAQPNMQQVPPELRPYLVPPPGMLWASCDYGQQELRILAHLSGDRKMKAIFAAGEDLHQQVANEVGITRKAAKAINFGIVYGAGPRRISQELGIPYNDARATMDSYFERFHGVDRWIKDTTREGNDGVMFRTIGGRKVQAEWIHDQDYDNSRRYVGYKLPNLIIQGSGADMMLQALINIDSIPGVELLTVVHDEANCAISRPEDAKKIQDAMLAASNDMINVPMVVDAQIGAAWA
jgi:DNA polymerase-1